MCGIVGVVTWTLAEQLSPVHPIHAGLAAIAHRGPDSAMADQLDGAVFGTARLAMVDKPTSMQPMRDGSGRYLLSFNGEIYNFRELRGELAPRYDFRTTGDTEVLLAALIVWGVDALARLKGQFALALWDAAERTLLLARDRFGIVPLHWIGDGAAQVVFASEVKALKAFGLRTRLSMPDVIDSGILWGTHPGRSIFAGVEQVPPGGFVRVASNHVERGHYWAFRYAEVRDPASLDEQGERLRCLLGTAVERRLPAYGDPAVLLSGGLDSSAVVALLREAQPSARIASYSIQFTQAALNEESFQALAAATFDTDHMSILCGDLSVARTLIEAVEHAEQPLSRTAPASSIALAATIKGQGTRAVLSGEGADELFCGDDLFQVAAIRDAWSRNPDGGEYLSLLTEVMAHQKGLGRAVERAFYEQGIDQRSDPLFSHLNRWKSSSRIAQYLNPDLRRTFSADSVLDGVRTRLPEEYAGWSVVEQAQYLEATYFLSSALLASQCDRPYMAHSVEARYPFLDEDVVDFALGLPQQAKLDGLHEKAVLKRAVGRDVPAAIRDRVKQPYTAPEGDVFRTEPGRELLEQYASRAALDANGLFDPKRVGWLINKLISGATSFHDDLALLWVVSTQALADDYGVADPKE